jgi:hypothetical protein
MAGKTERSGSCLCGAVRISIRTTGKSVGACHCSMCRKWAGGPLLVIECGSDVHFERNDSISVFSSSDWAERGFCSKCGSHLFYRLKKEGHTRSLSVYSMTGNNGFLINRFLSMKSRRSIRSQTKRRI